MPRVNEGNDPRSCRCHQLPRAPSPSPCRHPGNALSLPQGQCHSPKHGCFHAHIINTSPYSKPVPGYITAFNSQCKSVKPGYIVYIEFSSKIKIGNQQKLNVSLCAGSCTYLGEGESTKRCVCLCECISMCVCVYLYGCMCLTVCV